ncbi:MAG TPA: flagellar hook capping FlgD N-terminal domain-containing protein [Candidatus Gastranaerophilales bacterium]|nr:flagellar hook capping FlgD N-terminal domain-containing protein [Candidatus Gastranaerophilales bacterium]
MNQSQISDSLTSLANSTEAIQYANRKTGSSELGQDAFLQLMMKQMQYQDPLNPMDNSQMLAQQAQFTTINELQKLNSTINASNQIMQASSLIGKTVTLPNPDNPSETIEGKVTEAKINKNGAAIVLNGDKDYPMSSITGIKEELKVN